VNKAPAALDHPSPGRPRIGLRLPREGWTWLVIAGFLLVTGLLKGINLLALFGCLMLVLWALNFFLAGRHLRRLRGRRWINGPVFAGTPFAVTVEVTNSGRTAFAGLRVEDDGGRLSWFTPLLQSHQTQPFVQDVVLPRRGAYTWGALVAASGYPFGLVQRRLVLAPPVPIVVLPRLGKLHRGQLRSVLPPVGLAEGRTSYAAHRHAGARAEFHGLRAFRSGDSPRWIHWRTTARCGELMVREFEDVPMNNLVVVLAAGNREQGTGNREQGPEHPVATKTGWGQRVLRWLRSLVPGQWEQAASSLFPVPCSLFPAAEDAVSLAATICWEWCRQGGDWLVLAADGAQPIVLHGFTGRDHALRLLEALARWDAAPVPAAGSTLPDLLAPLPLPPAPILVVSGGGHGGLAEGLRQKLRRPVACVDTTTLSGVDWYEKPAPAP
jgi:uncharacterized protein (DUF58 family)